MITDDSTADRFRYGDVHVGIDDIIAWTTATSEGAWQQGVVRSADGTRNCFFGHLHAYGSALAAEHGMDPDAVGTRLWDWFESCWATTFFLYPVNDGTNPRYRQPTPRQRVLGLLEALRDGRELRTMESMEQAYLATERE